MGQGRDTPAALTVPAVRAKLWRATAGACLQNGLDLGALTSPVPGHATPAGEDLRAAGADVYFRLKDLRIEARNAEREAAQDPEQAISVYEAGRRLWDEVAEAGEGVLAERSKDLEVAGWVCEALLRTQGFAGLRRGLQTMLELIERFWDEGLYPHEDEDGVETRIAPVAQLLGQSGVSALAHPIKLVPLSDRDSETAYWKLEIASAPLQAGEDPLARERAVARRDELLEQVNGGVKRAGGAFVRAAHADITACLELIDGLAEAADARAQTGRFGSQAATPLRAILQLYQDQAAHLLANPLAGGRSGRRRRRATASRRPPPPPRRARSARGPTPTTRSCASRTTWPTPNRNPLSPRACARRSAGRSCRSGSFWSSFCPTRLSGPISCCAPA